MFSNKRTLTFRYYNSDILKLFVLIFECGKQIFDNYRVRAHAGCIAAISYNNIRTSHSKYDKTATIKTHLYTP